MAKLFDVEDLEDVFDLLVVLEGEAHFDSLHVEEGAPGPHPLVLLHQAQ
eukprot:CAMPEP_0170540554 /NCGR_PEP_ID=MMETSP0211-20121228/540_1 /TAXON_ID=311385 /ORGANISM="Pseudokeronopsis sp., Strain OXSARD2" /LENGTH=48 /DNA_ID= /DNA_START= /DNA_END= /DNA_ORIENTATION=